MDSLLEISVPKRAEGVRQLTNTLLECKKKTISYILYLIALHVIEPSLPTSIYTEYCLSPIGRVDHSLGALIVNVTAYVSGITPFHDIAISICNLNMIICDNIIMESIKYNIISRPLL